MTKTRYLRAAPYMKKGLSPAIGRLPIRPYGQAARLLRNTLGSIAFADSMETYALMVAGSGDILVSLTPRSMWWHA